MKFWPLIAIFLLSACLDENIADHFVADGSVESLTVVASESQVFTCVVAIYRATPAAGPPELAQNFEPWSINPLTERVHEMAIEIRVLGNADECWNNKIRKVTGSHSLWEYLEAASPMNSFDHGGNVALFDPQRNLFIAFTG
ncbi:hypothetical protein Q0601_00510 [Paracoccus onubensis]|uniref:hypothetical protein n=1 Tax=Paracoccus onubensis TaxID=1675788 RepID=UPI00272FAB01|nr:hypothetical protein [Paracoccus onubensis]MDP0925645.1 hypothetical protein [Paracoccus onubensis]